jgi:cytochrome c
LYMLEYGSGWFTGNDDARLIRIEYNGGNRKPQIQMLAQKEGGAAPFNLKVSSKGSADADGDALKYTWTVSNDAGFKKVVNTPDLALNLRKKGLYQVQLSVDDGRGGSNTQQMEVAVGNEPPVLSMDLPNQNKSFFSPNKPLNYTVAVQDKEDGSLGQGITNDEVAVNIDYLAEGFDKVAIAQGHRSADASAMFATGKKLIDGSDCRACHGVDKKSIGPSYRNVAQRYKDQKNAVEYLSNKIIAGGGGVWGETAMAGHPQLTTTDAGEMVKYILSLGSNQAASKPLPASGAYEVKLPQDDKGKGVYILRAAYEDRGTPGLPPMRTEKTMILRNATMDMHGFDQYESVNKMAFGGSNLAIPAKSGAYIALKQVDLTAVKSVQVMAVAPKPQLNAVGGKVELRLGSPTGTLLGESSILEPSETLNFAPNMLNIPVKLPAGGTGKPLQDVYLVFVNPKSSEQSLMVVMGTTFVLE